jgi:hypothetical protein
MGTLIIIVVTELIDDSESPDLVANVLRDVWYVDEVPGLNCLRKLKVHTSSVLSLDLTS